VPSINPKPYGETVPVGGSITFTWTSNHDLWEVPSSACPTAFANGTGITQLAARSSGGSKAVDFPTAGTRYFACSVSTHCEEGESQTCPQPAGTCLGFLGNFGGHSLFPEDNLQTSSWACAGLDVGLSD